MTTPTTNYGWGKPVDGGDFDNWGNELNGVIDAVDSQVHANDAAARGYANTAQSNAQGSSLQKAANLSDLGSVAAALGTLGLVGMSGGGGWGNSWSITIPVEIGGAVTGVIVQGGIASTIPADSTTGLIFPIAFPNACWGVYPSLRVSSFDNTKDNVGLVAGTPSRTGCVLANNQINGNATVDIPWWAIGY